MPGMGISRVGNLCDKNSVPQLHYIDTQGLRKKEKSLPQTMQSPPPKKKQNIRNFNRNNLSNKTENNYWNFNPHRT
jgi:hypothetical protein